MGRVKEFAIWLAECVYEDQMSEEEILSYIDLDAESHPERQQWVEQQLETIRTHPDTYKPLAN